MDSITKALINFIKHGIRNTAIICATIALFISTVVALITGFPILSMTALIIIGGFTVLGAVVGALVALLFIKFIFPQLGINYSVLEVLERPADNKLYPRGKKEMVIDYELTTEDVMQFRMYYYDHSPRQLNIRKLRKLSLIFSFFVAVFAAVLYR